MSDGRKSALISLPLLPLWLRILLTLSALGGIVYFSIVPPPGRGSASTLLFGVVPYSTALHFTSYAGLAIVFAYASYHSSRPDWQLILIVFATTVGCGALIEVVQTTLPTRTFSVGDMLVNSLGASVGVVVWRILHRFVRFYPTDVPPGSERDLPGRRLFGLVGLGARRVFGRARIAPQRVVLSVLGVGIAVGLMIAVTGISLGLASQSVVASEDVDYWIVPENADVESIAVSAGGLQLGGVHDASDRLNEDPRVRYATPVLLELLPVEDRVTGDQTYVLAVGVVARPGVEMLGLSSAPLTPGDPYYANGSYDGEWTGEVVFNDAAATLTNTSTGQTVSTGQTGGNRTLSVVNVTTGQAGSAVGTTPVAVMHLSELQALTGATEGDQATQLLVSTTDQGVREDLEGLYPRTSVVTRSGLGAQEVTTSNLPLAVAVAALVAAVVVGVLFVTTLMGLEVSADRQHLGTLAAVGFARRSLSLLVTVETVVVSLLGGVTGFLMGWGGIIAVNRFGTAFLDVGTVARFDPRLLAYAVAVAGVIGIVGAVYPVILSRRTDVLEALSL